MNLEEALEEAAGSKKLCGVYRAMKAHPQYADTIFEFITFRHDKQAQSISEVLNGYGIDVPSDTVRRHRKNLCTCDKLMPERYDVAE